MILLLETFKEMVQGQLFLKGGGGGWVGGVGTFSIKFFQGL